MKLQRGRYIIESSLCANQSQLFIISNGCTLVCSMYNRLRHFVAVCGRWWQMQQITAGGGSCRHHTERRHCFVHPFRPELRRKQFGWRHLPKRTHPDPHHYGKCPGAVWPQIAAIYSSLEEASLYSLLDYSHSVGMTRFYLSGMCRHPAAKLPPFRQRHSANVIPVFLCRYFTGSTLQ